MLQLPQASLSFEEQFYSKEEADSLYHSLLSQIAWQHDPVKIFGKVYLQPRLTAFYGNTGKQLSYSGLTMQALPWSPTLLAIREKIATYCQADFNCVLLNQYRNGQDSNGWHADNESYLGKNPVIASLSLGATRQFHMKHNTLPLPVTKLALTHGSLLIMAGTTQHYWKHQIPKTRKPVGTRINLTYRLVL